ncbi:hypothetical protein OB13_10380 [Pontibacter sp. HJ8]
MLDPDQQEIKKLRRKLEIQERKNTEIRDQMAVQRTIFANERTLMAYLRTALALIGGGFAALKLSRHVYLEVTGFILMVLGVALAVYSFARYLKKQRLIQRQIKEYIHTSHHHSALLEQEIS